MNWGSPIYGKPQIWRTMKLHENSMWNLGDSLSSDPLRRLGLRQRWGWRRRWAERHCNCSGAESRFRNFTCSWAYLLQVYDVVIWNIYIYIHILYGNWMNIDPSSVYASHKTRWTRHGKKTHKNWTRLDPNHRLRWDWRRSWWGPEMAKWLRFHGEFMVISWMNDEKWLISMDYEPMNIYEHLWAGGTGGLKDGLRFWC